MARRGPAGWSGRSGAFLPGSPSSKKSALMPTWRESGSQPRSRGAIEGRWELWGTSRSYGVSDGSHTRRTGGSHRGQAGGIERQRGSHERRVGGMVGGRESQEIGGEHCWCGPQVLVIRASDLLRKNMEPAFRLPLTQTQLPLVLQGPQTQLLF